MGGRRRAPRAARGLGAALATLTTLASIAGAAQEVEVPATASDEAAVRARINSVLARLEGGELAGDEAEESLRAARAAARSVADPRGRDFAERAARVEWRLAEHLRSVGRLASAERDLAGALERWGPDAPFHRALLRLVRAQLLRRLGRVEEALDALARLDEDLEHEVFDAYLDFARVLRVNLHGERAQVWRDLGVPELSAAALEEERALAESSGQPLLVAAWRLHRASLDLIAERSARAADDARAVLATDGLPPTLRAQARLMLGGALSELEREDPARTPAAARELEAALAERELRGTDRLNALLVLADLALRADDAAAAARWLDEAGALVERWDSGESGRFPFQEGALLAVHRARAALAWGDGAEELAARLVEVRAAYAEFLAGWARAPLRRGGVGFLHSGDRRLVLDVLSRLVLEVEGGERGVASALGHVLEAQRMGTVARALGVEAATPDDVRAELIEPGGLVLLYLPSMQRTLLFAIDTNGARLHELPSRDVLRRAAAEHHFARASLPPPGTRPDPGAERAAWARGERLAELLLPGAVRARLATCERLTVVGENLLGGVLFEALPLGADALLGEAVAVDHLPSLPVGLLLARRGSAPTGRDLLLATAVEPGPEARARWPELEPLPLDDARLARLTDGFDAVRADVLRDVTRPRLLAASLEGYAIVHVLAHGAHDPDRERGAVLVLAPENPGDVGLLSCEDVEGLAPSGLVVLSACGAAQGPERRGDDRLAHLGGAFLIAGARAVLLSSERVEYATTLALMESLHDRLARGEGVAEALRAARADVARGGDAGARDHAASFRLIGLGGLRPVDRAGTDVARSSAPATRTSRARAGAGRGGNGAEDWTLPAAVAALLALGAAAAVVAVAARTGTRS